MPTAEKVHSELQTNHGVGEIGTLIGLLICFKKMTKNA